MKGLILLCLLCISLGVSAQRTDTSHTTPIDKAVQTSGIISERSLRFIDTKYSKLTNTVQKQSLKLLARIQKKEEKLKRKTALKDTALAKV